MITLYSTGCPRCLEMKELLDRAHITYTLVSNAEDILGAGIGRVPVLDVDGELMESKEAKRWINLQSEGKQI